MPPSTPTRDRESLLAELAQHRVAAARLEEELGLRSAIEGQEAIEEQEGSLSSSEHPIHELVSDHGSDFISVHAGNGDYVFASANCARLLGWRQDELLGKSAYEFFHPDDLRQVAAKHAAHAASEEQKIRYRLRKKAGDYIWVETRSRSCKSGNDIEQIICITRDVDEEEQERERTKTALSLLKDFERTTLVGGLVGTFHHELNNPLTIATTSLELLQLKPDSPDALAAAHAALARISDVIRELSHLAKLNLEQKNDVDLKHIIEQMAGSLDDRRDCKITLEVASVRVRGAQTLVWQCLQNVVFAHMHGIAAGTPVRVHMACSRTEHDALLEVESPCTSLPQSVKTDVVSLLKGELPLRDVPMALAQRIAESLNGSLKCVSGDAGLRTSIALPCAVD